MWMIAKQLKAWLRNSEAMIVNSTIYRKAALDRLSSPDDLDQMLTVTSGNQWLALLGIGIFVLTAVIWSIVARIPTKAQGDGILIGQGGVVNVVTTGAGVITNFKLKIGDKISAGDVVAKIAQPEILTSIQQAKNRLAEERSSADLATHVGEESSRLQLAALDQQQTAIENDIKRSEDLAILAADQVPVEQRLLERGLSTKQQVNARQQRLIEIRADIQKSKAQLIALDAQRFAAQSEPESRRREATSRVDELQRQLQMLEEQMETSAKVVSPFSGEVVELKVYEGSSVTTGSPVLSLQPEVGQLEVVAFVPTGEAKRIVPGMAAQVSPSIIKREEYGYMRGTVNYVSDFPTTDAAAMRTFENESLVGTLKAQGLANEVRIILQKGPNSSGYEWSSMKTPKQKLSSGTLCSIQVVTRERRPIELILPFLKTLSNTD
jgi:HlyD family secretion protein